MIRVTVSKDGELVKVWDVAKDEVIVGRGADADVQLAAEAVSRRHARIERKAEQGKLQVADLGAANGVYLLRAGAKEPERVVISEVKKGDQLHIEEFVLRIEEVDANEAHPAIDNDEVDETSLASKRTQIISMTDVLAAREAALVQDRPEVSGAIKVVSVEGTVTEHEIEEESPHGAWFVELTSDSGHQRRFDIEKAVALVGSAERCDVILPSGPGVLVEIERSGQSVSLRRVPLWPFPRVHVEGRAVKRAFLGQGDVFSVADVELKITLR